jgi:hypothetical protein
MEPFLMKSRYGKTTSMPDRKFLHVVCFDGRPSKCGTVCSTLIVLVDGSLPLPVRRCGAPPQPAATVVFALVTRHDRMVWRFPGCNGFERLRRPPRIPDAGPPWAHRGDDGPSGM